MIVRIKNIKYFDWEIPEELSANPDMPEELIQQLIDEHFDQDHLSVDQVGDDYYEFEEVL